MRETGRSLKWAMKGVRRRPTARKVGAEVERSKRLRRCITDARLLGMSREDLKEAYGLGVITKSEYEELEERLPKRRRKHV